ncbi:MAG TPA: glycosyltransferase [Candidatus Cybelea sp.]|nr:glycosyltransferase [Candidatus Cybelea sp.]
MQTSVQPSIATGGEESRPPVVLQVLPALETGGVERTAVDIAVALVRAGWGAVVASSGGAMVHELERAGAQHVQLPLASKNPLVMRGNIRRLERLIRERGVDIVHARSRAPAWSAKAASERAGVHFVTTFHGTYNHGNALKRRYNTVMLQGERVIANSAFIAEHVRSVYQFGDERLVTIARGVDVHKFDPARVSAERMIQLSQQWRLEDGLPVILLPGRLTRWKGQMVLVEALAMLGRTDVVALLVGDDQGRKAYRQELIDLIQKRGVERIVRIVDHCRDMPAAYMLADVVVSASTDPEAFGRVTAEAQAMGRPVIATDHGGSRETVLHLETGWLVPPGDAGALAGALDAALALDPATREAVAVRAREHILEHFTVEQMCDATLDVYAEIVGQG